MKPDPEAKLLSMIRISSWVPRGVLGHSHPRQQEKTTGNLSRNRSAHEGRGIRNVVDARVSHAEDVHDVCIVCEE